MHLSDSARRRNDPAAPVDVTIVVPAFDEADRLGRLVQALTESVDRAGVELIVVDDGSTDATAATARALLDSHGWDGRVAVFPVNRGKGAAVRAGAGLARGSTIVVMDADHATDLAALAPALAALDDHHLAIGVRSRVDQGRAWHRRAMTAALQRWVKVTTSVTVTDTQCGFKAYRAPAATLLFAASQAEGFAQDAEILDLATRLGMSIAEIPVQWSAVPGSKVRAVRDSVRTGVELARHRIRRHRIDVVAVTIGSAGSTVDELAAVVRSRVRRTDVVLGRGDRLLVLAAGAPEIAHRRIIDRLARAVDDLEATIAPVAFASLGDQAPTTAG